MANKIMKFLSETFGNLRGYYFDGQAWLYAVDVCKALEIKNARDAVSRLADDEKISIVIGKRRAKNGVTNSVGNTDGNAGAVCGWVENRVNLVNEAGVYRLIFTSRKPEAEKFKRWVFHEVLPSIRRTGEYRLEWDEARTGGKVTRRKLTDVLVELFKYAVERDEFHHDDTILYQNYSRLVNKTVGVTAGERDNLPAKQLFELDTCEYICAKTIDAGLEAQQTQHDIFEACKTKLNAWRELTE